MKKTGLYFGSFNPIHLGHCVIAQYLVENSDLEEVWFVVTPHNPHKSKTSLLNDRERLHLVRLAIGDNHKLRVSDLEFDLPQPSYTATTLAHASDKFRDREFCLIMGEDNLQNLHKWKNYQWILEHHAIYVYPRLPRPEKTGLHSHPKIRVTEAPVIELSSSFIRKSIKEGKDVSFMLPPAVWDYIDGSSIYRS